MGKSFAKVILVVEGLLFAAMLLADFGVLPSKVELFSMQSIMLHLSVVILIIASVVILKRSKDR